MLLVGFNLVVVRWMPPPSAAIAREDASRREPRRRHWQHMLLWLGIVSAYFQCPQSNPKAAHGHPRKALVSSVRLLMQEDEPKTTSLESFFNKVVVQTSKAVQESARATESALNDYVNSGWQVKKRAGQVLPEIRPNTADVVERSNQWLPSAGRGRPGAAARRARRRP